MLFSELFERYKTNILNEKYYKYSFPSKKSLQLYDFYVLDYLKYLVDSPNRPEVRDLDSEIEDSVRDAVKTLFPALREELLNSVFYAITAEIRHGEEFKDENRNIFKNEKYKKLYNVYLKYTLFHTSGKDKQKEFTDIYNIRKPSSKIRPEELEKGKNVPQRNISFKAANYAIEKTGSSRADFVELCRILYGCGKWRTSYGGYPWAKICKGWLMLNDAENLEVGKRKEGSSGPVPMGVAIDHVYDLQHNTDTVFNKLQSYYDADSGYQWIGNALDHKANVTSYYDLLKYVSGTVKTLAIRVLNNKLGTTWQKYIETHNPNQVFKSNKKLTDGVNPMSAECAKIKKGEDTSEDTTGDAPKDEIKSGDFVICVDNSGLVDEVTQDNKYEVVSVGETYLTIIDDHGYELTVLKSRFKPLEYKAADYPDFKKGDTIVCKAKPNNHLDDHLTIGKTYEVLKVNKGYIIGIEDDKGELHGFGVELFDLSKENKSMPNDESEVDEYEKFKIDEYGEFKIGGGDYVECIDNRSHKNELTKNKKYQIVGVNINYLIIKNDHGDFMSYIKDIFKPFDENKSKGNTFKVGDKVVCIDNGNTNLIKGNIYTIYKIHINLHNKNDFLDVRDNDGILYLSLSISRFKKVEGIEPNIEKKPVHFSDKVKVGDILTCKDNSYVTDVLTINKNYKVVSVQQSTTQTMIEVVNDAGYVKIYRLDRFIIPERQKKMSQVESIRASKLQTRPKFKIGELVNVKGWPDYEHKILDIDSKDPKTGEYLYEISDGPNLTHVIKQSMLDYAKI